MNKKKTYAVFADSQEVFRSWSLHDLFSRYAIELLLPVMLSLLE